MGDPYASKGSSGVPLGRDAEDAAAGGAGDDASAEWPKGMKGSNNNRWLDALRIDGEPIAAKAVVAVVSTFIVLCTSGSVFGWPPLLVILQQQGAYHDLCSSSPSSPSNATTTRQEALFTIATSSSSSSYPLATTPSLIRYLSSLPPPPPELRLRFFRRTPPPTIRNRESVLRAWTWA